MTVDLYELEDIFARLPNVRDGERKRELPPNDDALPRRAAAKRAS